MVEVVKMMKMMNCVTRVAPLILSAVVSMSYANTLRVPVGSIGYLGEVSPPLRTVYFEQSIETSRISANFPFLELITWKIGGAPYWDFNYYAPESAYGVELVNERDKNNKIVLLINGHFSATYPRYNTIGDVNSGYHWETSSFTLKNSKMTSSVRMYQVPISLGRGTFAFGLEPQSGVNGYFPSYTSNKGKYTGTITSYSAYAPQPLKKGRFFANDRLILVHRSGEGDGYFMNQQNATFINAYEDMGVFVVDSCQVSPISNTKIDFGTQLAGTFPSPKNLANAFAQLNVNCPNSGKYFMSIKSGNALVQGSQTGMVLDSTSGNAEDLPYIATSIGTAAKGDEVCAIDSSQAINYTESEQVYSSTGTNFIQGLNFALCVNGKIAPGGYRGSLNVNFLIE